MTISTGFYLAAAAERVVGRQQGRPLGAVQAEVLGEAEAEVAELALADDAAGRAGVDGGLVEADDQAVGVRLEDVLLDGVGEGQC